VPVLDIMLRPIFTFEAFWDSAEAGEPQSDETIKAANKPKLTLNRLKEDSLDKAPQVQF
jgi:hypothetical protein